MCAPFPFFAAGSQIHSRSRAAARRCEVPLLRCARALYRAKDGKCITAGSDPEVRKPEYGIDR